MKAKLTKAQRSEASDVAEQMSIEPEQFAFELVSLRSQLAECQRERDERIVEQEKWWQEEQRKWMDRAEAAEQQLQQMKDALKQYDAHVKRFATEYQNPIIAAVFNTLELTMPAAARALVSGKGQ